MTSHWLALDSPLSFYCITLYKERATTNLTLKIKIFRERIGQIKKYHEKYHCVKIVSQKFGNAEIGEKYAGSNVGGRRLQVNFYLKTENFTEDEKTYRKWWYKLWIMILTTSIVFLISLWLYTLKRRTACPIPRLQESFKKKKSDCVGWPHLRSYSYLCGLFYTDINYKLYCISCTV